MEQLLTVGGPAVYAAGVLVLGCAGGRHWRGFNPDGISDWGLLAFIALTCPVWAMAGLVNLLAHAGWRR